MDAVTFQFSSTKVSLTLYGVQQFEDVVEWCHGIYFLIAYE